MTHHRQRPKLSAFVTRSTTSVVLFADICFLPKTVCRTSLRNFRRDLTLLGQVLRTKTFFRGSLSALEGLEMPNTNSFFLRAPRRTRRDPRFSRKRKPKATDCSKVLCGRCEMSTIFQPSIFSFINQEVVAGEYIFFPQWVSFTNPSHLLISQDPFCIE